MIYNPDRIAERLRQVRATMEQLAQQHGRDPEQILLLAVSKTWPAAALQAAHAAGQAAFGESYVQEALEKMDALADLPLQWHFIGPLQSNKTRQVATRFDWVHSIERIKIAERLSAQRSADLPPLNVCLQVNVSGEASKSGCSPEALPALAAAVATLPGLRLRGLMAIPAPADDLEQQRLPFRQLRQAFMQLNAAGYTLDTLSMGMSGDLEAAIAEGSTLVRVGSAIFGSRQP